MIANKSELPKTGKKVPNNKKFHIKVIGRDFYFCESQKTPTYTFNYVFQHANILFYDNLGKKCDSTTPKTHVNTQQKVP